MLSFQVVEDGRPSLLVEDGDAEFIKEHVNLTFETGARGEPARVFVQLFRPLWSRTARRSKITSVVTNLWERVAHDRRTYPMRELNWKIVCVAVAEDDFT